MHIEQIYTGCLAQGAYYIRSGKEAAIIDPLRETKPYLEKLRRDGVTLKYIFETHFHADFVSGHLDLAKKTNATIVYGPTAQTEFDAYIAKDEEIFHIGDIKIKVLHTPGHTMESVTYLLIDGEGKEHAIFSGDTLFIGDVGRPDLAQKAASMTQEELAGILYDSLRSKIMPLPDSVIVYPAHGAGSACGKNMSKERNDTLGNQKQKNYALRADMTRDEFVKELTDGLMDPPYYFAENVRINKHGYESLDTILDRGNVGLSPRQLEELVNHSGALILDTRHQQTFKDGFIPGSIFIGLDGGFAPWVGTLIPDVRQPIIVVTDKGREEEAITRLARVGYDNTLGYLEGGIDAWKKADKDIDTIKSIPPDEFAVEFSNNKLNVLDIRKPSEYDTAHLDQVNNYPLSYINEYVNNLNPDDTYHIHCAGGYRSMIAASILKSRGYRNVVDLAGGFGKIKNTGLTVTSGAEVSAN